jgi:hypothetical protein
MEETVEKLRDKKQHLYRRLDGHFRLDGRIVTITEMAFVFASIRSADVE